MPSCKYFTTPAGCGRGISCQYSHNADTSSTLLPSMAGLNLNDENKRHSFRLQPQPQKLIAWTLSKGEDCPFNHGLENTTSSGKLPLRLCAFFARGKCTKGDDCHFRHALTESNRHSTLQSGTRAQVTNTSQPILPTTTDTPSTALSVTLAATKNYDNTPAGILTRALSGGLAMFGDGVQVYKVSVPSDFTTIKITGLPHNTTIDDIEAMLARLGLEVPGICIKITSRGTPPSVWAFLQIESSMMGPIICEELQSAWNGLELYAELKATPVMTNLFSAYETSRQVDCRKVVCSWYRPSKLVVLKYENEHIARIICNSFNDGSYKVLGKVLTCDQPIVSKFFSDQKHKFLCVLKNVPLSADEEDITGAIDMGYTPDDLIVGRANYESSEELTLEYVKALCSAIGPLDTWDPVQDPAAKRVKVRVRFHEESDAREAIAQLNDTNIEILGKGKIMVQQIIAARYKITTKIFSVVQSQIEADKKDRSEHRIFIGAFQSTDVAQKFTSLILEGESGDNFVNAKNKLEKILAGKVALTRGEPIWNDYFLQPIGLTKLKKIEKDCDVVIDRDRRRKQLRLHGAPRDIDRALYMLRNMIKSGMEGYAIKLTPEDFQWISNGGFEHIVSALGKDVASIDVLSTPKKLLLSGDPRNYYKALKMLKARSATIDIVKKEVGLDEDNCVICWSPAEFPLRTQCGHLYCLECFKNLCSSTTTGDKEVSIVCNPGECDIVLSLKEIQLHLTSDKFEEILEASFTSYIRRHPLEFRYCPTPDCGQIYRVTVPIKSRTCSECLIETCIPCYASHTGQTCVEYKYQTSGGDAALEKIKLELGCKDCPKCTTTIEKTYGCNHMICSGCKIHICWVCLATFEKEKPCYDHLIASHRNIGLEEVAEDGEGAEDNFAIGFNIDEIDIPPGDPRMLNFADLERRGLGRHGIQMLEQIQRDLDGW